MANIRSLGRILAHEGIDDSEPINSSIDAAELEGRSDATEQHEILNDAEEISSIDTAIEDMVESTDVLEQQEAIVDPENTGDNGVAPETAEAIQVTVESFRKRLGLIRTINWPSRESYKDKNTRIQAGVYCHESVKSFIVDAWKKIVAFFKSMYAKVKAFVVRIFTATGRLKARSKSLNEKINKTRGEKKEDTFKNKSIAHAFTDAQGKFNTSNILDQLTFVAKSTPALADVSRLSSKSLISAIDIIKKAPTSTDNDRQKVVGDLNNLTNLIMTKVDVIANKVNGRKYNKEFSNPKSIAATDALPGNRALVFYTVDDQVNGGSNAKSKVLSISMAEVSLGPVKDIDEEIDTAETSQMTRICDLCELVSDSLEKLSKSEEHDDSAIKALEELSSKLESKLKDKKNDLISNVISKDILNEGRKTILVFGRFASNITLKWSSIALFGAGKALDYVAESLSCYEAE